MRGAVAAPWGVGLLAAAVLALGARADAQAPAAAGRTSNPTAASSIAPVIGEPDPSASDSWLGWGALGLGGVAVLLGGAALTFALDARRRASAADDARQSAPAVDPRIGERIARLETAVRALGASAPPTAAPTASAGRDPFPPRAPDMRADPRYAPTPAAARPGQAAASPFHAAVAADTRAVAPSGEPRDLAAWSVELTEAFARLARDPSAAAADYIARHRPRGAAAGPDGIGFVDGLEGAKLWAVRAPGEAEVWALTPGEQAAMNWSAHFAPHRLEVAAEVFGAAFDLVEGGGEALRLETPALVRQDGQGRLSVRRRGRLSGFRG